MIKFACPKCGAVMSVPDEKAGAKGSCPKCKTPVIVPSAKPGTKSGTNAPFQPAKQELYDLADEPAPSGAKSDIQLTKDCPFCGEEIKSTAIKCKHCGEMLDNSSKPGFVEPQKQTNHINSNNIPSSQPTAAIDKLYTNKKLVISRKYITIASCVIGIIVLGIVGAIFIKNNPSANKQLFSSKVKIHKYDDIMEIIKSLKEEYGEFIPKSILFAKIGEPNKIQIFSDDVHLIYIVAEGHLLIKMKNGRDLWENKREWGIPPEGGYKLPDKPTNMLDWYKSQGGKPWITKQIVTNRGWELIVESPNPDTNNPEQKFSSMVALITQDGTVGIYEHNSGTAKSSEQLPKEDVALLTQYKQYRDVVQFAKDYASLYSASYSSGYRNGIDVIIIKDNKYIIPFTISPSESFLKNIEEYDYNERLEFIYTLPPKFEKYKNAKGWTDLPPDDDINAFHKKAEEASQKYTVYLSDISLARTKKKLELLQKDMDIMIKKRLEDKMPEAQKAIDSFIRDDADKMWEEYIDTVKEKQSKKINDGVAIITDTSLV